MFLNDDLYFDLSFTGAQGPPKYLAQGPSGC